MNRPHIGFLVARLEPTNTFLLRDVEALSPFLLVSHHALVAPTDMARLHSLDEATDSVLWAPLPWSREFWGQNVEWLRRAPNVWLRSFASTVAMHWQTPRDLAINVALFPFAAAAAGTMRRRGVQHVHAAWANHSGTAARTCARLLQVPYSVSVHAWDLLEHQGALARKTGDAAVVVACSAYARRRLLERVPELDTDRVVVCHHGLDLARYPYVKRRQRGSSELFCLARLTPKKGLEGLLRAMHRLVERDVPIRCVIAGPAQDRAYARRLRGLGAEGPARHRIEWVPWMTPDDVRNRMRTCSVYVQPSVPSGVDADGIPNAVLEAMASGAPVIASNVGGIGEVIHPGRTGWLVEPGDDRALAETIETVLTDPTQADQVAREARAWVEERHDLRRTGERFAAALAQPHARVRGLIT